MAVPFRKVSKTRKRTRRAHNALLPNSTGICPNCKAVIRPHRVCSKCGYYKGQEVVKSTVKEDK